MNTSIILAQILGLYMTIMGLLILVQGKHFMQRMEGFTKDSPLMLIGILMGLIIGILLVVFHNIWVWGWPVVITILGWFIFIRSIIYLFFPNILDKLISFFQAPKPIYIAGTISFLLGLFFLYHGYF